MGVFVGYTSTSPGGQQRPRKGRCVPRFEYARVVSSRDGSNAWGRCEIFGRGDDGITDFDIDEATARAWAQSIASLGREGFELVKLFTTSSDAGLVHHEIWVFRRTIS